MAYRTRVNDREVFGNNECYVDWIDFIKSKGIVVDEDGNYEGDIDDVMGMFAIVDKITRKLIAECHEEVVKGVRTFDDKPKRELTDLTGSMWLDDATPLLIFNQMVVENYYCFLPYQFYLAVKDKIERIGGRYTKDGVDWSFCTYKLKDGEKIHVSAS